MGKKSKKKSSRKNQKQSQKKANKTPKRNKGHDSDKTSPKQRPGSEKEKKDREAPDSKKPDHTPALAKDGAKGRGPSLWILGLAGVSLLVSSVLPWASTGGETLFLPGLTSQIEVLPAPLHSPGMATLMLYLIPILGLALVGAVKTPPWLVSSRPWLTGGVCLAFLLVVTLYNPQFSSSPFGPHHTTLFGAPLGILGAVAAGAFWSLSRASSTEEEVWSRPLLFGAVVIFLLSAVIPSYNLGQRSIPFVGELRALGKGGSSSISGVISLLTWAGAGILAWWLGRGERASEKSPLPPSLLWTAIAFMALHQPIHLLSRGLLADKGGLSFSVLSLPITAALLALSWSVADLVGTPSHRTRWSSPRRTDTAFWTCAGLLLLTFFLLESQAVGYTVTDENIYYYQASLVAQGELPYRDFFFAHPPIHILIPALFFALFGFHLVLAKMISISAAVIAGVFVLLTGRKILGRPAALIALCLYLFSFAVLNAGVNLTGINLTVMFLLAGVYAALSKRPILGGALTGLALSTGFYSAAAGAALLLFAVLLSPRFGLRFGAGLFLTFGTINLLFFSLGGSAYLDGVYRYHGRKIPKDPRHLPWSSNPIKALFYNLYVMLTSKEFKKTVFYHAHLIWGFLIALLAWVSVKVGWLRAKTNSDTLKKEAREHEATPAKKRKKTSSKLTRGLERARAFFETIFRSEEGGMAVVLLVAGALVVEFSMFTRLHSFYFVLWYPFMALSVAFLLDRVFCTLFTAAKKETTGKKNSKKAAPKRKRMLTTSIALLALFGFHHSCGNWGHHVHKSEFKKAGTRLEYPWRKPKILNSSTPLVKNLFWVNHRIRGQSVPAFRQFLWNKKRHFDTAPSIAAHIRKTTKRGDTIAGASAVAPLLAILSNRRIADNFVDTNSLRFRSGFSSTEEFYKRVCRTPITYIVSAPRSYFSWRKMRHFKRFLNGFNFDRAFVDHDVRYGGTFTVRLLRRNNGATKPPFCRYRARKTTRKKWGKGKRKRRPRLGR